MMYQVIIKLADFVVEIRTDSRQLYEFMQREYYYEEKNQPVDFCIYLEKKGEETLSTELLSSSEVLVRMKKDFTLKQVSLTCRTVLSYLAITKGVLLLHGASFQYKKEGYVLCGPSGVGKSTTLQAISSQDVLSDDTVIIQKKKQYYIYTCFLDKGKYRNLTYRAVPLKKIFILNQAPCSYSLSLDLGKSTQYLLYNHYLYLHFSPSKLFYKNDSFPQGTIPYSYISILAGSLRDLAKNVKCYNIFLSEHDTIIQFL